MNTQFSQSNLLKLTLAGAASAFAFSHAALAESTTSGLSAYDKNSDGMVSKEEFMAKGGTEKTFAARDANGDGQLDKAELIKSNAGEAGGASMPSMPPETMPPR